MTTIGSHHQSCIVIEQRFYDHARHHTTSRHAPLGFQAHVLSQRPLCLNIAHAADQHISSADTTAVDKIELDAASHRDVSGT